MYGGWNIVVKFPDTLRFTVIPLTPRNMDSIEWGFTLFRIHCTDITYIEKCTWVNYTSHIKSPKSRRAKGTYNPFRPSVVGWSVGWIVGAPFSLYFKSPESKTGTVAFSDKSLDWTQKKNKLPTTIHHWKSKEREKGEKKSCFFLFCWLVSWLVLMVVMMWVCVLQKNRVFSSRTVYKINFDMKQFLGCWTRIPIKSYIQDFGVGCGCYMTWIAKEYKLFFSCSYLLGGGMKCADKYDKDVFGKVERKKK